MNLMPRHLSLRARLITLVVLLFTAFALFFLLFFPARMDDQARHWMLDRTLALTRLLASATEPALDFADPAYGNRHLETLDSIPEAVFALLLREDGTPLSSWHPERAPKEPLEAGQGAFIRGQEVLARVPIQTRGGQQGTLLLGLSLAELQRESRRTQQHAALISALIIGIGMLAASALGTLLVKPLNRVTNVALRISEGDLGAQGELDLTRRDETGPLAAALSRMLDRLYEQRALIESQVRELRSTQEQLIVADRRTSVGTLAAGVAHEINNPLAYVTANLQFALRELPELFQRLMRKSPPDPQSAQAEADWEEVRTALCEAREGCARVQHIVQSLKSFSRGDEDKREPTDLPHTLETAINMAGNEIRHRARLVRDYQPVPPVEANEVRLAQVFLNLLINAAHAIEPGAADQNEIRISTRRGEDGRVRVAITDTGSGMTAEIRNRLFTPFFTTKPVGVGTGLGLSVCQGIVTSLGGLIEVQSEPGHGSTFTVVLPPCTTEVHDNGDEPAPPPRPKRARILVVDDEPLVGAALRRILGREHEVLVTTGAREALTRVRQGPPFDVILCDLMMPEMTGMEFYAELQRTNAEQARAVLFLSGGAFTETTRAFLEQHQERAMGKPIDMGTLRERLHVLLESHASPASPPITH